MNNVVSKNTLIDQLWKDLDIALDDFKNYWNSLVDKTIVTKKIIELSNGVISITEWSNVEIMSFNFNEKPGLNSSLKIAYNGIESQIWCTVFLWEAWLDDILEEYKKLTRKISEIRNEIKDLEYTMIQENTVENVVIEEQKISLWKKLMGAIS